MKNLIKTTCDRLAEYAIIAALTVVGCALYEKGRADAVAEIYARGWTVCKPMEDDESE